MAMLKHGTLRFVRSTSRYSVYRDSDDEEVYLAHGTRNRLVPVDEIDHNDLNIEATTSNADPWHLLAKRIIEDVNEQVTFIACADCSLLEHSDEALSTANGDVCEACEEGYTCCDRCGDMEREGSSIAGGLWWCDHCITHSAYWCDECDEYDTSEHTHSCMCEAPRQNFHVRNRTDPNTDPLSNDTRITISLPQGVISDEGMYDIALRVYVCLDRAGVPSSPYKILNELEELGQEWQTKRGNFTKRLSRLMYRNRGVKLPPEVLSEIGNIARAHSGGRDFTIEVTRNLNLPAKEFAHGNSCWWQSYADSRCALKSNGGFGLRTFDTGMYWADGRAWVMPLRHDGDELAPTFNTLSADAYIVFNGYGYLKGYAAARIIAAMNGMTYRKREWCCSPMYINGDSGYLVAPEHLLDAPLPRHIDTHSNIALEQDTDNAAAA